jgi:hypothetical protein
MKTAAERRAANDRLVSENIRKYGCHVISVFDPERKQPTFSYSVGIQETTGAPEAIVVGVRHELGHAMVNEYNRQSRAGARFKRGTLYSGFLEGFSVYVEPARKRLIRDYTLGCERHYGDREFAVVQIIYPTVEGVWPWEKAASTWFSCNQPMLGRKRPDRP